jgi:hypothetical protein
VEAIASGNKVTSQLAQFTLSPKANERPWGCEIVHGNILGFEKHFASRGKTSIDKVLYYFSLSVDRDASATGEFVKVDAVTTSLEPQLDPLVDEPFPFHAFTDAGFNQQVDGVLLQHPSTNALLDVFAASTLQDNRLNSLQM